MFLVSRLNNFSFEVAFIKFLKGRRRIDPRLKWLRRLGTLRDSSIWQYILELVEFEFCTPSQSLKKVLGLLYLYANFLNSLARIPLTSFPPAEAQTDTSRASTEQFKSILHFTLY